ncbi:MAG: FAD:protein FMN transferase [Thiovulaceae bacterium]|nr:FAD:protein FMN transferase [Sulfurimonadaceae bacterium]
MAFFEKALKASSMSTQLLIRADVSKPLLYEAYAIAVKFEERYSAYREESFLNSINKSAGISRVACSEEDIALFRQCLAASQSSGGDFDITIGALSHGAYHFGFSNQNRAAGSLLQQQKKLVDFNLIDLDDESIFLTKRGVRLDLGGIGKGYVAKKIALFLQEKGAKKALVDLGGEMVSFGKSYTVALKDPFSEGNIAYIKTSKAPMSISTSGDYERFIASRDTHHILDKKSGSSPNFYSSMTVLQNGFNIDLLDAYATAMFNNDPEYVKSFSKKLNFATITVDREASITLNNINDLNCRSIMFSTRSYT